MYYILNYGWQKRLSKSWRLHEKAVVFKHLPDITLTFRLTSSTRLLEFFYCSALRSATLYWSKYLGNIALILNKESVWDKRLAEHLTKHEDAMGMMFEFYYEPSPNQTKYFLKESRGYQQQLYSSFLTDLFIQTPVIAYTDSDAKFTTPVTQDNIFNGEKLKVKGIHAKFRGKFSKNWAKTTKMMLGVDMVADFMSYFPVYIWKDTIANCRKFIMNHVNSSATDFIEVFSQAQGHASSPVVVIMTYAYYFEKHRYDFHIDIRNETLSDYNKKYVAKGFELGQSDISPDLHVQIHDKHFSEPRRQHMVSKLSYCRASRNLNILLPQNIQEMCDPLRISSQWFLFQFEHNPVAKVEHLTTWCKNKRDKCDDMINKHYEHCDQLFKLGIYDLDISRIDVVEKVAAQQGIYCKPYW
ncbi:hypothetical protein LOTGIDRAFT_158443 [Lottia gigantea]|uniref:Nucleotide-diphospho-sugar transferase domain-containing protein n=1 Tax=Lottia gigantea TaxID=225164 RepID=V4B026_LOTGI|nr:hypothetical protein LOTGIDRAFT_158443 [Lottia gigantea]ESO99356.1 hypothetical protein LOTGIDRAFT_158443 [Lottia gigantea]